MSLEDWLESGQIREHKTSVQEIADLLAVTDRDLRDCQVPGLSPDRKLATAYNAALQMATAALAASGYRTSGEGHHYWVIQSLAYTIKPETKTIRSLDSFRKKRNISDYERAGMVSEKEAAEMLSLAKSIRDLVFKWLQKDYPELMRR